MGWWTFADWLDFPAKHLLSWGAAGLVMLVLVLARRPVHHALGVALMTTPLWFTFWNIIDSIEVLRDPNSRLLPYTQLQLSRIYFYKLLRDIGYVGLGFLILTSGGRLREIWSTTPRSLARHLHQAGLATGGRSEAASLRAGLLVFPVFLVGAIAVNYVLYSSDALTNGDEASVWNAMTPYAALMLALAAGFGEEIVYRGVLLGGLLKLVPSNRVGVGAALFAQALFFGFAHGGYGTWAHVLAPLLFGLLMGVLAMRWGLWAAIALHVAIDVVVFSAYAAQNHAWFGGAIGMLLLANGLGSLSWAALWVAERLWPRPATGP